MAHPTGADAAAGGDAPVTTEALVAEAALPDATAVLEVAEPARYARGPLLGIGGMARVVAATDLRLGREVALKEVAAGAPAARLVREARIAAQLEHPGIVPVYDAGTSADGRVWYAMRLVRGRTFADALAARATLAERVTLLRSFLQACEAVAFAHDAGIVHRDLKPANVLIGEHGETQVADWGVARPSARAEADGVWDDVLPHGAQATVAGAVVGTPAYMSPEQARGQPADPRSDVYGLGAMLYELLTGRPPFAGSAVEVLEAVRRGAIAPVRERAPDAPPELAAIAERALAADPQDRYESARQLAADVARFVDGRMVAAYAYTPWDHLVRFVRARRAPLAISAAALLALLLVGWVAWRGTQIERDRAVAAEAATRASLALADRHLAHALEQQAQAALELDARGEAEVLAAHVLRLGESPAARGVLAAYGDAGRPRVVSRAALPECPRARFSSTADRMLCLGTDDVSLWTLDPPARRWSVPVRARDGVIVEGAGRVALTLPDVRFRLLDADTGAVVGADLVPPDDHGLLPVAPGRFAVVVSFGDVLVVDAATGAHSLRAGCRDDRAAGALAAAVSPDESQIAVVCADGTVWVGAPLARADRALPTVFDASRPAIALVFTPDGRHLVVGNERGEVALVDAANGATVRAAPAHVGRIVRVEVSPGGDRVAVTGDRGGVRLWRPATGAWETRLPVAAGATVRFVGGEVRTLGRVRWTWALPEAPFPRRFVADSGHAAAALSPDGRLLAAATGGGSVPIWSTADGASVATLHWQDGVAKSVAFSPDGRRLAAAGMRDRHVRLFDTADWSEVDALSGRTHAFRRVGWLAGGVPVAVGYLGGPHLWPGGDAVVLATAETQIDLAVRHDGRVAAVVDRTGAVARVFAGDPPRLEPVLDDPLAFAVDLGERWLAVGRPHAVALHDAAGGRPALTIPHPDARVLDVALSPSGEHVATAGLDGAARLFRTSDGALQAVLRGHGDRVAHVSFSADGATLVSASWDRAVRLWDLRGLDTPADALVPALEAAWGLDLDDAVGAAAR